MSVVATTKVVILLWSLLLPLFSQRGEGVTDPSDIAALMEVKSNVDAVTIAAGSCLSTWDFSLDPCDSVFGEAFACGISCAVAMSGQEQEVKRIVSLELDSAGYGGTLSAWMGNLTALQVVVVSGNAFRGELPSSLAALQALRLLDLSSNLFTGPLPPAIGSLRSLQTLNVARNLLTGHLPSSAIANLTQSLLHLQLFDNSFTGPLPNFSSFTQLRLLDLSNNDFFSYAPPAAAAVDQLQLLHLRFPPAVISVSLRNNRLDGELGDLVMADGLNVLDMSGNNMSGAIDGAVFFTHPSLQQLNLSSNAFTRIVEESASGSSSQLVAVDLSRNQIEGPLPQALARMPRLASLSLSHNRFSGRIEVSYAMKAVEGMVGLQPLRRLMLDSNYLTAPLPSLFFKLLPDSIIASVVDNCLFDACPPHLFFCRGAAQKPHTLCRGRLLLQLRPA